MFSAFQHKRQRTTALFTIVVVWHLYWDGTKVHQISRKRFGCALCGSHPFFPPSLLFSTPLGLFHYLTGLDPQIRHSFSKLFARKKTANSWVPAHSLARTIFPFENGPNALTGHKDPADWNPAARLARYLHRHARRERSDVKGKRLVSSLCPGMAGTRLLSAPLLKV